jgi:hypothetical protein
MARYFLRFRHSDTGLTPTFTFFKKASDLSNVTPPSILELGSGTYYFDYTPTFDIVFEVDGGASIPTEEVRYIADTITPKDAYVDEPVSQVKDDVWNDANNRALGTKGDFVEHIGLDTDAVDDPTVFGKVYKARDAVMGGTGYLGTGVDVKTVKDTIGTFTDNSVTGTVFGKILQARETIRGDSPGFGDGNNVKQVYDRVGAPTGASVSADIAALQSSVTNVDGDVANVQTTVNTINTKVGTPVTSVSADIAAIRGLDNRDLTDLAGGGFTAGDSLQQIKVAVDQINVETDPAAIANAVWNELISSHQTANSMGRVLNDVFRVLKNKAIINATTKQLEVYDDAGASIIFTFDLKDENGVASATRIFRRLPL